MPACWATAATATLRTRRRASRPWIQHPELPCPPWADADHGPGAVYKLPPQIPVAPLAQSQAGAPCRRWSAAVASGPNQRRQVPAGGERLRIADRSHQGGGDHRADPGTAVRRSQAAPSRVASTRRRSSSAVLRSRSRKWATRPFSSSRASGRQSPSDLLSSHALHRQPLPQPRPAPALLLPLDGDGHRLGLRHQHHQLPPARDAGVEQVPPQHRLVPGRDRDHHRRVLRALRLVHGGGIGQHQLVQLAEAVGDLAPVEVATTSSPASGSIVLTSPRSPLNTSLS